MKTLLLLLLSTPLIAFSSAPLQNSFPYSLPEGLYSYQDDLEVENIRKAETVDRSLPTGKKRISELENDGFNCIRQNPTKSLCVKNTGPLEASEDLLTAARDFLKNLTFEFNKPESEPTSVIDTSTEHQWNVRTPFRLGSEKMDFYRFVYFYETDKQVLTFPVNEDQPISLAHWQNGKLGLNLIVTEKVNQQTWGYILKAWFQK